jgi:hypothetical protein
MHASEGSDEHERLFPVHEVVSDMTREEPDGAWSFVLAVLEQDNSVTVRETLSAGPLEDLLVYHGAAVIERVEQEAKANPRVASLLGGVWQNAMPEAIWKRVQAVWDRRGWDDVPAA